MHTVYQVVGLAIFADSPADEEGKQNPSSLSIYVGAEDLDTAHKAAKAAANGGDFVWTDIQSVSALTLNNQKIVLSAITQTEAHAQAVQTANILGQLCVKTRDVLTGTEETSLVELREELVAVIGENPEQPETVATASEEAADGA
jgi:hypothetical protein